MRVTESRPVTKKGSRLGRQAHGPHPARNPTTLSSTAPAEQQHHDLTSIAATTTLLLQHLRPSSAAASTASALHPARLEKRRSCFRLLASPLLPPPLHDPLQARQ